MDRVTLTHEQFLSFTGWSEKHTLKKIQADRIRKLENMGMQSVTSEGRGMKANYSFSIPAGFWRMLLLKSSMAYTEIGVDYINHLIEGKDMMNTEEGILVRFNSEIYNELSEKYNAEYKGVEATCTRIRNYLMENDYIRTDSLDAPKSHRVKTEGSWVTGTQAIMYDQEARSIWTNFFRNQLALYQELHPEATQVPSYVYSAEAKRMYQSDIARWLEVDYYRVAKLTLVTDNMIADINYGRMAFLETHDLTEVRMELSRRQEHYRAQKQRREEQKNIIAEREKAAIPSIEERKAIREQMNEAARRTDVTRRHLSQDERDNLDRIIAAALNMTFEELQALDNENEET